MSTSYIFDPSRGTNAQYDNSLIVSNFAHSADVSQISVSGLLLALSAEVEELRIGLNGVQSRVKDLESREQLP